MLGIVARKPLADDPHLAAGLLHDYARLEACNHDEVIVLKYGVRLAG